MKRSRLAQELPVQAVKLAQHPIGLVETSRTANGAAQLGLRFWRAFQQVHHPDRDQTQDRDPAIRGGSDQKEGLRRGVTLPPPGAAEASILSESISPLLTPVPHESKTSGVMRRKQGNEVLPVTLDQPSGHQLPLCRAAESSPKFRHQVLAGDKVLVRESAPMDLTPRPDHLTANANAGTTGPRPAGQPDPVAPGAACRSSALRCVFQAVRSNPRPFAALRSLKWFCQGPPSEHFAAAWGQTAF